MTKPVVPVMLLLVLAGASIAAFEEVSNDPWLEAGAASSVYPLSPFVLGCNPASIGLLEGSALSCSAARPFGLRELDRAGLAACLPRPGYMLGVETGLSGDRTYSEISLTAGCATRVLSGLVAGVSISGRRLSISGYGHGAGASLDAGMVYSPMEGVYGASSVRGLLRTRIGDSQDPCVPRSFQAALGVCPLEGLYLSAGARSEERLDMELSMLMAFSPCERLLTGVSLRTDPVRFSAALSVSLGPLGLQYGFFHHTRLPPTHSVCVTLGECRFRPAPLPSGAPEEAPGPARQAAVDLNSATCEQLETVPGIGPAKAASIVAYRNQMGPFRSVDHLLGVPGIGAATLESIRPYLYVDEP